MKVFYSFMPKKHNHKNNHKAFNPVEFNMDLESIITQPYNPLSVEEISGPTHERRVISNLSFYLKEADLPFKPLRNILWTKLVGPYEVDLLQLAYFNNERIVVRYEVKVKETSIGSIRHQLLSVKNVLPVLVEVTYDAGERIKELESKGLFDFSIGAILIDSEGFNPYIRINI